MTFYQLFREFGPVAIFTAFREIHAEKDRRGGIIDRLQKELAEVRRQKDTLEGRLIRAEQQIEALQAAQAHVPPPPPEERPTKPFNRLSIADAIERARDIYVRNAK